MSAGPAPDGTGRTGSGLRGSTAHYRLTRRVRSADISSTQPVRFLDLVWASALGRLLFAYLSTQTTLLGGAVIVAATLWVARRERRRPAGLKI